MNTQTEQKMKDVMENASLKELLPSFDKEALWAEIAPEIISEQKKAWYLGTRKIYYAAALALLIGVICAIMFTGDEHSPVIQRTIVKNPVQQQTIITPEATPTTQPATQKITTSVKSSDVYAENHTQQRKHKSTVEVSNNNIEQETLQSPINQQSGPLGPPVKETPAIAVVQVKKQVKHYLDIEDATQNDFQVANPPAAPKFISFKLNKPDTRVGQLQDKPLGNLNIATNIP